MKQLELEKIPVDFVWVHPDCKPNPSVKNTIPGPSWYYYSALQEIRKLPLSVINAVCYGRYCRVIIKPEPTIAGANAFKNITINSLQFPIGFQSTSALLHEMGHLFSSSDRGLTDTLMSGLQDWTEVHNNSVWDGGRNGYYGQDRPTGKEEAFAQSFANFWFSDQTKYDRKLLPQLAYDYMCKIFPGEY